MDEHVQLSDAEIVALNKFPQASFKSFVLYIFELFINAKDSEKILCDLENFCSDIGANFGATKSLVTSFLSFLQDATKRCLSYDIIFDRLRKCGLSEEKSIAVCEVWKEKFTLLFHAVDKIFATNQLVDMEWKFGVTAATSENNLTGQSFLQLKLVLDKGNKQTESLNMELTLPQFYTFLHEMEKARSSFELI
ncbi:COMM domain-containing protein 7 [Hydra vulgaris]|uniref:COMM domain-containing protein 7 n=1 Tax=Hydra vulgaris TaxID=6087 RepID=A0ABM4C1Z0_HYDVU